MAKQSIINRELKRARTVAKYATKRAALKAQLKDQNLSAEEKEEAQRKFQSLPRNAAHVASVTAAVKPGDRTATTVNSACLVLSCAKPPCAETFPVWLKLAGKGFIVR